MNRVKEREFVSWDGEGISDSEGPQRYVLFGASTGDRIIGHSLSTTECLDLLLAVKREHLHSVFVGFATDYDVNMILKDMPEEFLRQLWSTGKTIWGGYRLRYFPHKIFGVSRKGAPAVILFDVFTFFGTSFVRALSDYNVGTREERDFIGAGKARRNVFRDRDLHDNIVPYWEAELRALIGLCQTLRSLLQTAGIYLSKWHGPGAVASTLLSRHDIKSHIREPRNEEVVRAGANAYAGGRFERFRIGRYVGEVWQYDIRSAYPDILRRLPALKGSRWIDSPGNPRDIYDWSLYHCAYYEAPTGAAYGIPHWRYRNGNVAYPLSGEGTWIYGATLRTMLRHGWRVDIDRCLELHPGNGPSPFAFVEALYQARQVWKKQGNQAQWAAKLGMNSLYGKLAQTVTEGKIPPFHCLEWAGMITAAVRAQIADALYEAGVSAIACETDSVFTLKPLNLPLSDRLGDWEESKHDEIIYLQSGVYFLDGAAGKTKTRGINGGLLRYETVCDWLQSPDSVALTVPNRRFHGMGTGLNNGLWRYWVDDTKTLNPLDIQSKRYHVPSRCPECREGMSFYDGLHSTEVNPTAGKGASYSHRIPWLTSDDPGD